MTKYPVWPCHRGIGSAGDCHFTALRHIRHRHIISFVTLISLPKLHAFSCPLSSKRDWRDMTPPRSVAILGGGLTGLTAAYRLSSLLPSAEITVLEGSSRLGGWIGSELHRIPVRDDKGKQVERDIVIETGPRSIRPRGSRGAASTLKLVSHSHHSMSIPL